MIDQCDCSQTWSWGWSSRVRNSMNRGTTPVLITSSIGGLRSREIEGNSISKLLLNNSHIKLQYELRKKYQVLI